jgi:hypothetical protein
MRYSHYWYRPHVIPDDLFSRIRADFEKLVLPLETTGIQFAGALGEGPSELSDEIIQFNGLIDCGHPANEELIISYPSPQAEGVGPSSTAIDGSFYDLGVTVRHRCCNGSCCYEAFTLGKAMQLSPYAKPDGNGLCCDFVKTGLRPCDLAVTATLLIAKRHLRNRFVIHSNGGDIQWSDARRICQQILGYGDWFGIIEEQIQEWPGWPERTVTLRLLVEVPPPSVPEEERLP